MRRLALIGAALAVVAVVVVGVLVARNNDGEAVRSAPPDSAAAPAPEVAGTDPITGEEVSLTAYRGKPVVVNIWASWCPPCAEEAPDLARFARKHPEAQVIGVDIRDSKQGARAFYRRYGWTHPSIYDPTGAIAESFGLQGQPIMYFLNERHEVVHQIIGASDLAGFEAGLKRAKRT
jgi:cytochrome c biogenesis protein CcmG/thiol:disulfide interchange protein DsbE